MPLVAHTGLPTYKRLLSEGRQILSPERALTQEIRELHIGFLNMMPDAALEATERQFFRLVNESSRVAQIYIHPFTLPELKRGKKATAHIDQYYERFEKIKEDGLDALIVTGANVTNPNLADEAFWKPLQGVLEWARAHVTSTLCSCLATHAVMEFQYGQRRQPLPEKKWGVYEHRVVDRTHPVVRGMNTRFHVPHSRWNAITPEQFKKAGMKILIRSEEAGVHMATSKDGFRLICFQGHPEYDIMSLLKEYKREILLHLEGKRSNYPPFPAHYFSKDVKEIATNFRKNPAGEFPEKEITKLLDNTWSDSARSCVGNWIGLVYQTTHVARKKLFMDGIDPENPLESL